MKGRTVSETSVAATLTAKGTKSPASARMTCSAMVTPALSWASAVDAPRWGATTTEDSSNSGDSVVGSLAKTSRPAPWTWPDRMASARASSSTMPPRAVLMMRRPGLALASRSLPMRPERLGVLRQVDGDEVGVGHQLVEGHQLDPHVPGPVGRHERVVGHQAHAEGQGPLGHQGADPAQTDHARGSCRAARRPPTWTAPTSPPPGRRGPGGCCGPGPAAGPWPARRPRGCSTGGR